MARAPGCGLQKNAADYSAVYYTCRALILCSAWVRTMNTQDRSHGDDAGCPIGLIVLPALVAALVWVCAILSRLPQ